MRAGTAIAAGWLADRLLGEPPAAVHPVAGFGSLMRAVEEGTYRPSRTAGTVHTCLGVAGAALVGAALSRLLGRRAALVAATGVCIAGRMLTSEAAAVLDAVERGDLPAARTRVAALVGRDPTGLDRAELVRAVVESVAENTVDAVVSPLFWAAVGGAPAVLAHRAVNTLDAMIGHRDPRYERFGWAAARLDDLANLVPARVAACGVALLVPHRARDVRHAVRDDAPAHPSPNAGVIEAAFAAALGIRLGGTNRYGDRVEHRPRLGDGTPPTVADGRRALGLARRLGVLAAVCCRPLRR